MYIDITEYHPQDFPCVYKRAESNGISHKLNGVGIHTEGSKKCTYIGIGYAGIPIDGIYG
jgi:hypothetical protein